MELGIAPLLNRMMVGKLVIHESYAMVKEVGGDEQYIIAQESNKNRVIINPKHRNGVYTLNPSR